MLHFTNLSMHTLRTRFQKEIVAEFLPPIRKSNRVIIFCDGMPVVPSKRLLLRFFAKKGYWVFHPRYRGTWESTGRFLRVSPEKDILDIISQLPRGFRSFEDNKAYKVKPKVLYVIGSSFGGAAALLVSRDPRVTKVIAVSPVVDFTAKSKAEPLRWLQSYLRDAFGEGYRFSKRDWNKLKGGKFYNPMQKTHEIDGKKLFIIHARDDKSVSWGSVQKFSRKVGTKPLLLKRGGHLPSSILLKPRFYKKVRNFLKKS